MLLQFSLTVRPCRVKCREALKKLASKVQLTFVEAAR